MYPESASEPTFLRSGAQLVERAADGDVVALEHEVVAVLLLGMADRRRAQLEVVDVEVRRRARDPRRSVDHLLAQVEEQPLVVVEGHRAFGEPAEQRHPVEALLELDPDVGEPVGERVGAGAASVGLVANVVSVVMPMLLAAVG